MENLKFKSYSGNKWNFDEYTSVYSHNYQVFGGSFSILRHYKQIYVNIITWDTTNTLNQDLFFKLPNDKKNGYFVKYVLKLCKIHKVPKPIVDDFIEIRKFYKHYKSKKVNNTVAKDFKKEIVDLFDSKKFDDIKYEYEKYHSYNGVKDNYQKSYQLLLKTLKQENKKNKNIKIKKINFFI